MISTLESPGMDSYPPDKFLDSETQNLFKALTSGFLEIPHYQRPYAWTKDQVAELWQDLLVTFGRSWDTREGLSKRVPQRPHFYGPLVVEEKTDESETLLIIDGQQRVVTFSILIACLLERAETLSDWEEETNWKDALRFMLSGPSSRQIGVWRPRLKLGDEGSQEIYYQLICVLKTREERDEYMANLPSPEARKAKALTDAYRLICERLDAWLAMDDSNLAKKLEGLIRTLLELSLFLRLEVENSGVAYEVFEGLNARGLELSQADLVKNKLLQRASENDESNLEKCGVEWAKATKAISDQSLIDMPTFLQLHYIVHEGPVKAFNLYDKITEKKLPKGKSPYEYAKSLRQSAERLQLAVEGGASLHVDAQRDMQKIVGVLKNKFALALVIATTEKVTNVGSEEFASVVRLAHHFAFRHFVVEKTPLSTYSIHVGDAARNFRESGDLVQLAEELKSKSADTTFKAAFEDAEAKTNKIGFYVCEMIENHRGFEAGIKIENQSPKQHLEHIFPQNPGEDWPEVTDEALDSYINRYGNFLVLESDINQSIGNKAYSDKKKDAEKGYSKSKLHMPHELGQFEDKDEWTFDSIEKRQKYLADKFANKVWSLSSSKRPLKKAKLDC